jgi:hypothetical protein
MDLKQIFFYLILVTFAPACKHGPVEESDQLKQARVIQGEAMDIYNGLVGSIDQIPDSLFQAEIMTQINDWKNAMIELPHDHSHDDGHDHDHDHEHHESDLTDQQLLDGQKSWKEAIEAIKMSIAEKTVN